VSAKQHSVWNLLPKLTKEQYEAEKGFSMRARPTKFSKSGSVENRRRSNSQNLSRLCVWRCVSLVAWLFLGGGFFSVKAATLPAGFTESQWGAAMSGAPTAMAFAPDGRLFVCLQSGQVRVIDKDGVLLANPFVTLSVDSNGERGLLGVAFDPNFASNRYVYLYYTVLGSPAHNRISRFTANGNAAAANSEFVLVDLDNLSNATNHNGGGIHFGADGKLYAGVGENANGVNAQSLSNRLGKILRINSDGTIPSDNPRSFPGIAGSPSGANRAIWAVGLRNPFTFAFQPGTARLFINDVGQSTWEEINDGVAGSNYGWPAAEGPASPPNPNFRDPIFYYRHGSSNTTGCAVVGGAFYNPSVLQFPSRFVGKYFFADLCTGWIRVLDPFSNAASDFASEIPNPVDLHVGPDGALYYLTRGGRVFRIQATPSQAMNISTRARVETGDNVLIGGFIVTGSAAKKIIIRAIGPELAQHGITSPLTDPTLELHNSTGILIAQNDNWQTTIIGGVITANQVNDIQNSGHAPSAPSESAIIANLQPGNYTAIVRGTNSRQGIALAEVYDLDPAADSQLGNISGRSYVQTSDDVMIGGFIIGNNVGATKVIIRAIGPSLAQYRLSTVLADPTLELHDGNGALLESNDNWRDDPDQAARISAANLAPSNPLESAIWASLAPGNYTMIVRGKNNGVGIGLAEIYSLP
jgi:glucose/arabinose dehydrogenase